MPMAAKSHFNHNQHMIIQCHLHFFDTTNLLIQEIRYRTFTSPLLFNHEMRL